MKQNDLVLIFVMFQIIDNNTEIMANIQYLHNEGNNRYCICPDVMVTEPVSSINRTIRVDATQITHKYVNHQSVLVSEKVKKLVTKTASKTVTKV